MDIEYVGASTATKVGSTSGTSTIPLTTLTGGIAGTAAIGDLVLAFFASGSTVDRTLSITDGSTAYSLIGTELYADGTSYDTNLLAAYKFLTAADASVTFGATGHNADAGAMGVQVWRNVDPALFDVAAVTVTGTGTGRPNPGSITPASPGAKIIVIGAAAAATGAVFTAAYLTDLRAETRADTNDAMLGMGYVDWTSGAYDPAAFTGGTANAADSWAAITMALKPYVAPPFVAVPQIMACM